MKAKLGAGAAIVLLVIYLVAVSRAALRLIGSGDGTGIALGIAVIFLPVLVVWACYREVAFGFAMSRMGRTLADEEALPLDDLPRMPSGRIVRAAADEDFPRWAEAVEAHPEQWRDWYRLGLAYDACRDRRRARSALRHAARLRRDGAR